MTVQDISFGLKLASLAGWNQTEADWAMLLEQSTPGSFLACYNQVEAGTITTVTYQKRMSWVGMLLVAPEFQRRGIGAALLRAAIQAVGAFGVICLDATPAGKPLYDRLGFHDLYRLGRWLRPPATLGRQPAVHCHPLSRELLPAILAYDHPVFGADRTGIVYTLQRNMPALALFSEDDQQIKGFCLGRQGRKYIQIGPVIADCLEIARDLLLGALQSCAQQQVILDATYHHPGWNQLLHELGFVEQRPFIRMHLGQYTLPEHHGRQFAIAGPEMG
jgi:Acetyltransferase (GNAT) domain/Acetyltransferase (GNAT) family